MAAPEAGPNPDVLIVGAGPTGLMLANQLARQAIRTRIVDRRAGPARETRALGVQARTLEIYSQLGIVEEALARGKRATGVNLWADGRRQAQVPFGDVGGVLTPYPFVLILGQEETERILGNRLRDGGAAVEWNTELVALDQHPAGVTATLRGADGTTRQVAARWVAGCDGAHSTVRDRCRIPFVGAPYEQVFFVADTDATGSMVPDEVNVYLWRGGFHLLFPLPGRDRWRLVGIVPPALQARADLDVAAVLPAMRHSVGPAFSVHACRWFSTYHIQHRRAARFREGRCFLLGDAAHIHSPVGAQGMNTGLQDAYNLGWKLALVALGHVSETLLDSYAAERIPVAEGLLRTTDRAFRLIVSTQWWAGLLRTQVLARLIAAAMRWAPIQRAAFRVISQIGIHYRTSPLSLTLPGLSAKAPQAGDRFPWLQLRLNRAGPVEDVFQVQDDTRFTLLVFGQPAPEGNAIAYREWLRIAAVPADPVHDPALAQAGVPRPSFYLLRPDGHVGLCGGQVDVGAINGYLKRIGLRTANTPTVQAAA